MEEGFVQTVSTLWRETRGQDISRASILNHDDDDDHRSLNDIVGTACQQSRVLRKIYGVFLYICTSIATWIRIRYHFSPGSPVVPYNVS